MQNFQITDLLSDDNFYFKLFLVATSFIIVYIFKQNSANIERLFTQNRTQQKQIKTLSEKINYIQGLMKGQEDK